MGIAGAAKLIVWGAWGIDRVGKSFQVRGHVGKSLRVIGSFVGVSELYTKAVLPEAASKTGTMPSSSGAFRILGAGRTVRVLSVAVVGAGWALFAAGLVAALDHKR